MKKIIFKNTQMSLFPAFRCSKAGENFEWIYDFDLRGFEYNLNSVDQDDWCKLIGVKKNYFRPMENSFMTGFRYDIKNKQWDYNFYWHLEGKRDYTKKINYHLPQIRVVIMRNGLYLEPGIITIVLKDMQGNIIDSKYIQFEHSDPMYLINTWFGGNQNAPKNLSYKVNKIK